MQPNCVTYCGISARTFLTAYRFRDGIILTLPLNHVIRVTVQAQTLLPARDMYISIRAIRKQLVVHHLVSESEAESQTLTNLPTVDCREARKVVHRCVHNSYFYSIIIDCNRIKQQGKCTWILAEHTYLPGGSPLSSK